MLLAILLVDLSGERVIALGQVIKNALTILITQEPPQCYFALF